MSRKEFRVLASAISTITNLVERRNVAHLIGEACATQNKLFNWDKWVKACGCDFS